MDRVLSYSQELFYRVVPLFGIESEPRPYAPPAWGKAARDGHRLLLLRTKDSCRELTQFVAPQDVRYRRVGRSTGKIHLAA